MSKIASRKPCEVPATSASRAPDPLRGLTERLKPLSPCNRKTGQGRVTLVGAGPGDAELLTLKAIRALQSADVILFDDLVSDDVLDLARREARRMIVGKRGGRASCRQDDINALMIKLARQGKHVVRLKSGDPMLFGRAGEELEVLHRQGVSASVIPGITAASAAAAAVKVSLTHRDHAQSVTFVTGHARDGSVPKTLDIGALAREHHSTVVYMGGATSKALARALLEAGARDTLPCLAVRSITRPEEELWTGTLGQLGDHGVSALLPGDGPVLLAIGRAFSAVQGLDMDGMDRHDTHAVWSKGL